MLGFFVLWHFEFGEFFQYQNYSLQRTLIPLINT